MVLILKTREGRLYNNVAWSVIWRCIWLQENDIIKIAVVIFADFQQWPLTLVSFRLGIVTKAVAEGFLGNQWKHLVENGFVWQFCRKWHRLARLNKNPRGAVRGLTNIENRTQFFLSSIGSAFQYIFITGVRCTWTSWMLSTNVGEWITQRVLYGNQNIMNNISKGYFVIPAKISFNFSYFSQNFLHDSNCLDGETIPTENADGICSNCPSRFWGFW